jgi:hypothetical protein
MKVGFLFFGYICKQAKRQKLKKPLIFTLCLIPFAAFGGWFTVQFSMSSIDRNTLETAIQQIGSMETVMLIATLQSVLYACICGFFGFIIASKLGLIQPFGFTKKKTLTTLSAGAICGIILSADAFTFAQWIPELKETYGSSGTFDATTWIASIMYGGIIEEVMMRLFLMSLFALIGWKLLYRKEEIVPDKMLIISNIIVAALFAAGHLPATVMLFGHLTPLLIFRCFLMNGAFGIVFGRLYRKHGIQYAMLAHILTHIVSKTTWLLIL